jgi:tetraacyldisaccharide 4'-kinase
MVRLERYYRELAGGLRHGLLDCMVLAFLTPASLVYAFVLRLRALAFAVGVLPTHRLPVPVVSVGNLTVGGTGKTPTVALLAERFIAKGKRVAVLSRGYGSSAAGEVRIVADGRNVLLSPEEAGDEPYLLASSVPGLVVIIGADRYRAGLLAVERFKPDLVILDDGFQHMRLGRDLNILLLDCRYPVANGLTLPGGLLREPRCAAARADLIIYTRCTIDRVIDPPAGKPSCRAVHHLAGATPLTGGPREPFTALKADRGVAFAGIADPDSFFDALREEGLSLVATLPFPDHCRYGDREIETICQVMETSRADYLITTGKDAAKLAPYGGRLGITHVAVLEMRLLDSGPLDAALEKLL